MTSPSGEPADPRSRQTRDEMCQRVSEMIEGTGLKMLALANELVITNPAKPETARCISLMKMAMSRGSALSGTTGAISKALRVRSGKEGYSGGRVEVQSDYG